MAPKMLKKLRRGLSKISFAEKYKKDKDDLKHLMDNDAYNDEVDGEHDVLFNEGPNPFYLDPVWNEVPIDMKAGEPLFDDKGPIRSLSMDSILRIDNPTPEMEAMMKAQFPPLGTAKRAKMNNRVVTLYSADDPKNEQSFSDFFDKDDNESTTSSEYFTCEEDIHTSEFDSQDEMSDSEIDEVELEVKGIFLDLMGFSRRLQATKRDGNDTMQSDVVRFQRKMFQLDSKLKNKFY